MNAMHFRIFVGMERLLRWYSFTRGKKWSRIKPEDDFIREMYERDPTERYDWLYGKVHDKIDKTATWLEQKDIGLLLQEFEPINDF